jgi:hypothetical protein
MVPSLLECRCLHANRGGTLRSLQLGLKTLEFSRATYCALRKSLSGSLVALSKRRNQNRSHATSERPDRGCNPAFDQTKRECLALEDTFTDA